MAINICSIVTSSKRSIPDPDDHRRPYLILILRVHFCWHISRVERGSSIRLQRLLETSYHVHKLIECAGVHTVFAMHTEFIVMSLLSLFQSASISISFSNESCTHARVNAKFWNFVHWNQYQCLGLVYVYVRNQLNWDATYRTEKMKKMKFLLLPFLSRRSEKSSPHPLHKNPHHATPRSQQELIKR